MKSLIRKLAANAVVRQLAKEAAKAAVREARKLLEDPKSKPKKARAPKGGGSPTEAPTGQS